MADVEKRKEKISASYKENLNFSNAVWQFYMKYAMTINRDDAYFKKLIAEAGKLIDAYSRSENDTRKDIIMAVVHELDQENSSWIKEGI